MPDGILVNLNILLGEVVQQRAARILHGERHVHKVDGNMNRLLTATKAAGQDRDRNDERGQARMVSVSSEDAHDFSSAAVLLFWSSSLWFLPCAGRRLAQKG